jgi:tubulin---tyrosine ligase
LSSGGEIGAFELFGYDFMLDEQLNVYLIEVNTNPCLETPCSLLASIISSVLDHTFRLVLDPFFIASSSNSLKNKGVMDNLNCLSKFELVFDEEIDGNKEKSC